MPLINTFFVVCSVRTGGIIIGFSTLLLKGLFLIKCIINMILADGHFRPTLSDYNFLFTTLPTYTKSSLIEQKIENEELWFAMFIIITIAYFTIALAFIFGCKWRIITLLLPYLCAELTSFIIYSYRWTMLCIKPRSGYMVLEFQCLTLVWILSLYFLLFSFSVCQYIACTKNEICDQDNDALIVNNEQHLSGCYESPPPYEVVTIYEEPPSYDELHFSHTLSIIEDDPPPMYTSVENLSSSINHV